MSKLAEQINYTITNKRFQSNSSYFSFSVQEPLGIDFPKYLYQVNFTAIFGAKYTINADLTYEKSPVLEEILKNVKRDVVEEVFGEFRKPLAELRHSLYERDTNRALEQLSNIQEQMFNV